jgi:hypothetical protein
MFTGFEERMPNKIKPATQVEVLVMRTFLPFSFILLFIFSGTNDIVKAQPVQFGINAGFNISSHLKNFRYVSGDIDLDFDPGVAIGYNAGLIVRKGLTPSLRLQAEPSFLKLGGKYDESFTLRGFDFETESRTELYYVQLPLLLQLSTTPPERTVYGIPTSETTFHVTGGVFGGYLLDGRFSGTNSGAPIGIEFQGDFTNNVTEQYKEYDGGVVLGGGFERGSRSKIGFETRVIFSVIDSGNAPEIDFKPQNMAVTFSVYYLL